MTQEINKMSRIFIILLSIKNALIFPHSEQLLTQRKLSPTKTALFRILLTREIPFFKTSTVASYISCSFGFLL